MWWYSHYCQVKEKTAGKKMKTCKSNIKEYNKKKITLRTRTVYYKAKKEKHYSKYWCTGINLQIKSLPRAQRMLWQPLPHASRCLQNSREETQVLQETFWSLLKAIKSRINTVFKGKYQYRDVLEMWAKPSNFPFLIPNYQKT